MSHKGMASIKLIKQFRKISKSVDRRQFYTYDKTTEEINATFSILCAEKN